MSQNMTLEEIEQVRESAAALQALATALHGVATAAQAQNLTAVSVSDLRPTGELGNLAARIRANVPITDEDLARLTADVQADIKNNSRLNGLVHNVTSIIGFVRTTILPLVV